MPDDEYPAVADPSRVGSYPALTASGGGYVWDAVLEYRVWCHPLRGAPDLYAGAEYYHAFESYSDALQLSRSTPGAEAPLALIQQDEYISEPKPGQYVHVRETRITEWRVEFLKTPRRTERTIPDFIAAADPAHPVYGSRRHLN